MAYWLFFLKKNAMNKLKQMTIEELVAAEMAASVVRRTYEDKCMIYRGINLEEGSEDFLKCQELNNKLTTFNGIRHSIITEMEKRLLSISQQPTAKVRGLGKD